MPIPVYIWVYAAYRVLHYAHGILYVTVFGSFHIWISH